MRAEAYRRFPWEMRPSSVHAETSTRPFELEGRPLTLLVGALIAAKVVLLFVHAANSRFVMDEFVQLGWAKYLANGLFDTVWPGKAVGYSVFYKLAHVIGWDATSILFAGRMQTALLACATLAIIYTCARSLGETRTRSAIVLLILLSFSNFIERIFETRAEPLAVFFGAAALLVAIRGKASRWRILAAGALSGLAFLSTQKSIYFNVALGLALVGDAAWARRYAESLARGVWLILGWLMPVIAYCLIFGGFEALAVAANLFLGPLRVAAPQTAAEYGGLRGFVVQTLTRNVFLYVFCVAGMIQALLGFRQLDAHARIALIFTVVVAAFVFTHNQPWPYVFVMVLPFISLWAVRPFDALRSNQIYSTAAWVVLGVAVAGSFAKNISYLGRDNRGQLALVARAESLLRPNEVYFDGIGMLPNRPEPTPLWLDRHYVLKTVREGRRSEAYRIFADTPPKIVLWSYRMDAIRPVVAPLINGRYVRVAPNILMAGRRLTAGEAVQFDAPAGTYGLYSEIGQPLAGTIEIDGRRLAGPFRIAAGRRLIKLQTGPAAALLLPKGSYAGRIGPGRDNDQLFAQIYD